MASIFDKIRADYDALRRENERILYERRQEAYAMAPGLEEVEDNIRNLGFEAAKATLLSGDDTVKNAAVEELKTYEAMARAMLAEAGLPVDYLNPIYTCEKCKDKGYLEDGNRCSCMKQRITAYLHRSSHIERQIEKNNFGNFRLDIYSDMPFADEGISPRQNMEEILTVAENFVATFDEANDMNLLLYGPTGLGKTFLSHAVAAELMAAGKSVVYETAFGMVRIFEEKTFNRNAGDEIKMAYDSLFTADLLIIDDLGAELNNSFTNSQLFNIVNSRMIDGKKMIINTNLTPNELSAVYGDRIFSRIFHKFIPMAFFGKDLRWENE
ncbi:ATP-binding protein [Aedoeadaptatus urinae]|uniref:ATP-binding protein n=1 Tax=Aedoeadaptatus urinae TaxID=1871017 RepID=UPI00097D5CD1|nr:ATP-binding protein [Peptoniphilus urinae]